MSTTKLHNAAAKLLFAFLVAAVAVGCAAPPTKSMRTVTPSPSLVKNMFVMTGGQREVVDGRIEPGELCAECHYGPFDKIERGRQQHFDNTRFAAGK
jgi:hypothetical protein